MIGFKWLVVLILSFLANAAFADGIKIEVPITPLLAQYADVFSDPQLLILVSRASGAASSMDFYSGVEFAGSNSILAYSDLCDFRLEPKGFTGTKATFSFRCENAVLSSVIEVSPEVDVDTSQLKEGKLSVEVLGVPWFLRYKAGEIRRSILHLASRLDFSKMAIWLNENKIPREISKSKFEIAKVAMAVDWETPMLYCEPGHVDPLKSQIPGYFVILAWGLIVPAWAVRRFYLIARNSSYE